MRPAPLRGPRCAVLCKDAFTVVTSTFFWGAAIIISLIPSFCKCSVGLHTRTAASVLPMSLYLWKRPGICGGYTGPFCMCELFSQPPSSLSCLHPVGIVPPIGRSLASTLGGGFDTAVLDDAWRRRLETTQTFFGFRFKESGRLPILRVWHMTIGVGAPRCKWESPRPRGLGLFCSTTSHEAGTYAAISVDCADAIGS